MVHITGGVVLLGGIISPPARHRFTAFRSDRRGPRQRGNGGGDYLILAGFILNAAVPPLNAWLTDAYPEATVTGAVFMSAFTTKTAVYVLARAFPGTELLVWLGTIMALYGVIYAVLENDCRRLLGLSHRQPGGLHDRGHRHRDRNGGERSRQPRLRAYPL